MGRAMKIAISPTSLRVSDAPKRRAVSSQLRCGPDVSVTTRMARGLPHETLVQLGERMNLVVVGAHQANRLSQMVTGSVSVALVEHATCPVAVVPVSTRR